MVEKTVEPIADVASAFIRAWLKAVTEVVIWPPLLEIVGPTGEAARFYARWYNHRHPNRKISWRKLSRPQRRDAVALWLALTENRT